MGKKVLALVVAEQRRRPVDLGGPASIAAGSHSTCAQMQSGALRCWGQAVHGQLGAGPNDNIGDAPGEMLPPDVNIGATIAAISSAAATNFPGYARCVLTDTAGVRCCGFANGGLGYGSTAALGDDPGEMPPPDLELGGPVVRVEWGLHGCALTETGAVRCWGGNGSGELGLGHTNAIGDQPGEMPPSDVQVF